MVKTRRMTRRIRKKARKTRVRRMSGGEDPKDSFCENNVCPDAVKEGDPHVFGDSSKSVKSSCSFCHCYKNE